MSRKEEIKKFMFEQFGEQFTTDAELDEFVEKLLRAADKCDKAQRMPTGKVWTKEEIETLGIEVKPVDWKNFNS
tara:strand:+ start:779 stop:1000 length:222 start_codon:yes stop_codon:yes gene_type:complete